MQTAEQIRLMGMPINPLQESEAVRAIVGAARAGRGGWVITPNLDHLRRYDSVGDGEAREMYEEADLVLADGMPLVWASRLQATPLPERVAGSTMIWGLTEAAARAGTPIFLLGGSPGVAERTRAIFRERFPGVRIAGTHCPPLGFEHDPAEMRKLIDALRDTSPSMVYLALGHPKQEQVARRLRTLFPQTWFIGLGFSFGFIAGEARRAPRWIQRLGLEWMHRLAQEPRRLFARYVVHGLPFAARLLAHALWTRRRLRAGRLAGRPASQ